MLSPACDAVIEHVPGDTYVTSAPDTVHTLVVLDAYETVSPEEATADSITLPEAKLSSSGLAKVIVCDTLLMPNDRVTSAAAAYVLSPDWEAVILHVPAATKVTVDPDTVHTDVVEEAYETESELDAEADKAKEPVVNNCEAGSANVIDCANPVTMTDRESPR